MTTGTKTFGQENPRWFCPNRHSPIFTAGSFRTRHRCPRCSKQCHDAWAGKEYATVSHHLQKHLPPNCTVFRGHLHMPTGATVQNHADTRSHFMPALRCLKSRLRKKYPNLVLELRAFTHPTSPDAQHYDFLAYTTLSQDELRRHLRTLWSNAGGRDDIACVEATEGEWHDVISYYVKTQPRHRTRFYLSADNGLDFAWGTKFFTQKSKKDIWSELCEKWFPPPAAPLGNKRCAKAHHPVGQPTSVAQRDAEKVYRDDLDRRCIRSVLRPTPAEGLSALAVAHRSGTPVYRLESLLASMPEVRRIDQWQDEHGRVWNHSGYFIDAHDASDAQWQELSDYAAAICDLVGMSHTHSLRNLARTEFGTDSPLPGTEKVSHQAPSSTPESFD